ncbi:unnamed protein product, partial [Owenia fusiformis]
GDRMSMKLGASSGTYNVRASELAREPNSTNRSLRCIICFLDDTQETFDIDKRSKAQALLDKVFDHLELIEKDYFGLQYSEAAQPTSESLRWLDPLKTVKKQIRLGPPYTLWFRVKFYVSDPSKLAEEYTRYHFFLQLKKDILESRLVCPPSTAALLASFAVQSELGDFSAEDHTGGYLSEFRFIPGQTEAFEKDVAMLHRQHRGQTPADAEYNFLDKAKRLDMYGVDLHQARDQSNQEIQLGVTSAGLVIFQKNQRTNTFSWAKIVKISFKRKQFFIQTRKEMNDNVENLIGFNLVSYRSCKKLWKSCVEHHTFFRLHKPPPPSKKYFFSLGSNFRYSGRTEYQTLEESKRRARIERTFERSPSKRYARRTIGGTTHNAISNEKNAIDGGYNNIPTLSRPPRSFTANNIAQRQYESFNTTLPHSNNHTSSKIPKKSFSDNKLDTRHDDDDGGFLSRTGSKKEPREHARNAYTPTPTKMMGQDKGDTVNHTPSQLSSSLLRSEASPSQSCDLPTYNDNVVPNGNGHGFSDAQGLVNIHMTPDEQGRFGFNVKGGADQGMPIIVSRVAPNTPADLCIPRLNEGDQVLFINGRDVSTHSHEQVVQFIRASRETHSGELVLVVRPNVYVGEDQPEEPEFQYVPETHHISTVGPQGNILSDSLMLLQESLESGAALAQFEQLYRKKPDMTMNAARLSENINKNRYRDISPYDQSRVIIKGEGDYINANYVNMEIPGSGIVNRYIAAQGPLPNTCGDFWQMVWEQQSTLVVMLTTKVERGRVKCHQYWPDLYQRQDYGSLHVTCLKEDETASFAFREFTLVNVETNEERHVLQMQYIAWPDHGVPDDPSDFLDFVLRVRQSRVGMVEPTIVHCSAGIGRTGVLITMETAMCLIEANQSVYPLDIVRQMRDQRAMLIQTSSQYKFVCEAILRVYHEGLVQPLEDYQR